MTDPMGNAAFGQTLPGLVDGGLHEFVPAVTGLTGARHDCGVRHSSRPVAHSLSDDQSNYDQFSASTGLYMN